MIKHLIHPQAEQFIRSLAPEPRVRLIRAIKKLPQGDTKSLEGRLAGYCRLRDGGFRVIYKDSVQNDMRTFDCLFVERRPVVYDLFEQLLVEQSLT